MVEEGAGGSRADGLEAGLAEVWNDGPRLEVVGRRGRELLSARVAYPPEPLSPCHRGRGRTAGNGFKELLARLTVPPGGAQIEEEIGCYSSVGAITEPGTCGE